MSERSNPKTAFVNFRYLENHLGQVIKLRMSAAYSQLARIAARLGSLAVPAKLTGAISSRCRIHVAALARLRLNY
jgi:hypothetical protein